VAFKVVDGGSYFFGILEALRQDNLAKILSEPTLVTSSGRPAVFLVGGEIPYLVPQGLATTTIEWKTYGTRVDFVPIVLGNSSIRLEVRPEVSEIDNSRAQVNGVPALKISYVDTGVTIQAGQTLAIAGLVQRKTEAQRRGLPLVCDVPYLGVLFSAKREEVNEIESLILVTPELIDTLAPHEVPPCGPGSRTASPGDWDLYMKGVIESPNPCPPCNGNPCVQPPYGPSQQGPEVLPTPDPRAPQTAFRTRPQATLASNPVNRYNPSSPSAASARPAATPRPAQLPGYRGPVGYDAEQ
jgi:pilus assembly protein CpaC